MFQYSFVLKSITCIIYLIEKETSSEKIDKLYELSLILKSHACSIVTQNVIERFSVTIDCVRFLIRGFPLYTYSMDLILSPSFGYCTSTLILVDTCLTQILKLRSKIPQLL